MASNYTTNYNLCQWQPTDQVQRTDFNADNAKIDAALAAKADQTSLDSLEQTVNQMSSTISSHAAQMAKLGNCEIYTTSYTGHDKCGSGNLSSLTFPAKPVLVLIVEADTLRWLWMYRDIPISQSTLSNYQVGITWGSNSISWFANEILGQMEVRNKLYRVYALLDRG